MKFRPCVDPGRPGYLPNMTSSAFVGDASTLSESTTAMENAGFNGQFAAEEGALVRCFACRSTSPARDVEVELIRRVEGASDPADMEAVAAIHCPRCGIAGTLVLRYGPESTIEDDEVLRDLTDRRPAGTGGFGPPRTT